MDRVNTPNQLLINTQTISELNLFIVYSINNSSSITYLSKRTLNMFKSRTAIGVLFFQKDFIVYDY